MFYALRLITLVLMFIQCMCCNLKCIPKPSGYHPTQKMAVYQLEPNVGYIINAQYGSLGLTLNFSGYVLVGQAAYGSYSFGVVVSSLATTNHALTSQSSCGSSGNLISDTVWSKESYFWFPLATSSYSEQTCANGIVSPIVGEAYALAGSTGVDIFNVTMGTSSPSSSTKGKSLLNFCALVLLVFNVIIL